MMRGLMAIADEVLTQPVEATASSRPRIWLRLAIGFVVGLVLVAGAASAGLYAWDQGYEGRVLPGVTAGGVDLSGMNRDQATTALDQAYASVSSGQVVIATDAGDLTVPYASFGRRVNTGDMVDAALRAGREGTTAERVLGEVRLALVGRTIEPTLTLDAAALAAAVKVQLAALELAPVDAAIVKAPDGTYTALPAQAGRTFDGTAATAAALAVVAGLDAPSEVRVPVTATVISPAVTDVEVQNATVAADKMDAKLVLAFHGQQWKLKSTRIRKWITISHGADGSVQPTVNVAAIRKALKPVAKGVKLPPLSAAFFRSRGRVVGVAPSKDGRRLDAAATAAAIAQAITDRGKGAAPAPVKVRVLQIVPKVTTEEAVKKGPLMSMLGTWKTWFPISDHNFFGANIWQPARIIDGTVLYPGQRFEWWSAVGPVSTSTGFGPGGFIAGDHTEPTGALGGGMCSSSTTLFNAALRAGLRMGARSKSQVLHLPLPARVGRHRVQDAGWWQPDDVVHQRHEAPDRDPELPLHRWRGGLGQVRDLGHPRWPQGQPLEAVRVQPHPCGDADRVRELVAARRQGADRVPRRPDGRVGEPRRPQSQRAGHPRRHLADPLRALERRHPGRPLSRNDARRGSPAVDWRGRRDGPGLEQIEGPRCRKSSPAGSGERSGAALVRPNRRSRP